MIDYYIDACIYFFGRNADIILGIGMVCLLAEHYVISKMDKAKKRREKKGDLECSL